jgi:prepilin peptidase CpaA
MTATYLILFIVTLPMLFLACWSDLRNMTIPNRVNAILFFSFVILGVFLFPLQEYGIRLAQAAVMLVIGIFLTASGLMGGGDSKLLAAGAPLVSLGHITEFFIVMAVMSLAAVATHRILGKIPAFKSRVIDWVSWNTKKNFPFGVPIAATFSVYLLAMVRFS